MSRTRSPMPLAELIAQRFRVLGEPMRIRLLDALRDGEATVGELTDATRRLAAERLQAPRRAAPGRHRQPHASRARSSRYAIADDGVFALCEQVCGGLRRAGPRARPDPHGRHPHDAPRPPSCATESRGWPLERVLFAHGGHDDAAERAARRARLALVPAADRLRRRQPVALRRLRRLRRLARSSSGSSACARSSTPRSSTPMTHVRPDRPARPLDRRPTSAPSRSPGSLVAVGARRSSPRRSRQALSGAGWEATGSESVAGAQARSTRTSAASPATRADGRRPLRHADRRRPRVPAAVAAAEPRCARGRPRVAVGRRRRSRARRSRATATPRSSRPAPRADSNDDGRAPPTTSRASCTQLGGDGVQRHPDRRLRHVVGLQRRQPRRR